ncbi:MAG: hypothetical protein AVDCRST_MAG05-770 [uncultured Rubrobacteraceae bacterium]|uniref:Uncharacterized protein n=1 Tax=uncultured Rubrobacteraceae bacterium TaxID=349277 RepID=A0A6J4RJ15_9ACTN|nr:MAG: hypothetical protein AVDCRST_MAG05-770 [uncultured Rubrobacteraceae bacterium]
MGNDPEDEFRGAGTSLEPGDQAQIARLFPPCAAPFCNS